MHSQSFNCIKEDEKTAEEIPEIASSDIKKAVEEFPYPYIIHFDGKTLLKMNQGKKTEE